MSDSIQDSARELDTVGVLVNVGSRELYSEIAMLLTMENLQPRQAPTHEALIREFIERPTGLVIIEDSFNTLAQVRRLSPSTAAVFLSSTGSVEDARRAFLEGARDVFNLPIPAEALIAIIRDVTPKTYVWSTHVFKTKTQQVSKLTSRETEVLNCLVNGLSNKETGRVLKISPRTVEVHRARIIAKMDVRNTAHMVAKALSTSSQSR